MIEKIKAWFKRTKDKVFGFCEEHPDVVLTVAGGFASLVGGCIKLYCSKTEYDDYIYSITEENQIYKIPAKPVKTGKLITASDPEKLEE